MEYIVTIRVGGEVDEASGKKASEVEWPPMLVDAEDRWGALEKAVEHLGVGKTFPMRYLWKRASIVKKEKKGTRKFRVERDQSKIDAMEVIK